MDHICKNCNSEISVNFCTYCGQKKVRRIDAKYIKDEIQYTVLHTNKGFFYTLKKVIKAPGKTALEFIDGNRVNHYKPILLVFLLAGISAFITNTFIHPMEIQQRFNEMHQIKDPLNSARFTGQILKYQSIVMLLSTPLMAFFSWLAFKKWGHNYYEHVVANAFLLSTMMVYTISIALPLQFLLRDNPNLFVIIPSAISYLLMIGISFWFFIQLYPEKSPGSAILRVLLMYFLLFSTVMIVTIALVIYLIASGIKLPAQ